MNEEKIIKTILILLVLVIIASAIFLLYNKKSKKQYIPLISYSYGYSGNMNGSRTHLSVLKTDNEKALITSSHADWHFQELKVKEYYVPISVLRDIEKIYYEYDMFKFQNLPEGKDVILDAGSGSYNFKFEDKKTVSFKDTQEIPNKGIEGLNEIRKIIVNSIKQADKLPGLVINMENNKNSLKNKGIEKGVCKLKVYEYSGNTLHYRFSNGLDKKVKLKTQVELYRIHEGKREEIFRNHNKFEMEIYSNNYYKDVIKFTNGRLEAGKYLLIVSGYETEFEIK